MESHLSHHPWELQPSFRKVRGTTVDLVGSLGPEDCLVQAMPDVSPPKWHLAHTSWFFETFVLAPHVPGYEAFCPAYGFLFNSYYEAVGPRQARPQRGLLSRPTLDEVLAYRAHVDAAMERAWSRLPDVARDLTRLGIHHEQQHQELLVMDVKYNFGQSPLSPAYRQRARPRPPSAQSSACSFIPFDAGVVEIGHGSAGFAFDNEGPVHRRFVESFALADRLVTNAEYLAFVEDGGYRRSELWLSDGLAWIRDNDVTAPLYWRADPARGSGLEARREFTVYGDEALDPAAPVCHVSGYEAAAYAEWAKARLPTEVEWEVAASIADPASASWLEDGELHPRPAAHRDARGFAQLFGDVWEWTRSAYEPYPGFRPSPGAVGEYNGKFMVNQWVLRGGCVATPRDHVRATYRNFFYPHHRWPFTGIRLAKDLQ